MAKDNKKKKNGDIPENSSKKKTRKAAPKVNSGKGEKAEKESIKTLKEQILSEKDRVLRLSAEFENYKKRQQRESDEFKKFANETIFRQLLTVVDNLERAIDSTNDNTDYDGLLEGVKLTYKGLLQLFETFNVKKVAAENQLFDPNFHQAVTQEESDDLPENIVSKVLQKGYMLHDRLIRPAMVVVTKRVDKKIKETKEN